MPEITSAVVHQSVEAPQTEPLSKETDPYKGYDLVANKPAVVLLSLKPPQNIEEKREYKISLEENHQEISTKCSKAFNTIEITTEDNDFELKEKNCKLINRNFRNKIKRVKRNDEYQKRAKEKDIHNLNVFFELPTKLCTLNT